MKYKLPRYFHSLTGAQTRIKPAESTDSHWSLLMFVYAGGLSERHLGAGWKLDQSESALCRVAQL